MTKAWVPAPPNFGRLAEILYALDEPNWLPMLQDAMRTSLPGSLAELLFHGTWHEPYPVPKAVVGTSPELGEVGGKFLRLQPSHYLAAKRRTMVLSDNQAAQGRFETLAHAGWALRSGGRDCFGLSATDPLTLVTTGMTALVPRAAPDRFAPDLVDAWESIALHMLHAASVRHSLAESNLTVDAVYAPDGRCIDAGPRARNARDMLREAVRRVDRARGPWRDKPDESKVRTPRLAGNWTLVDQFDHDGKHYVVVYAPRAPAVTQPPPLDARRDGRRTARKTSVLSARERHVTALLASGWPYKRIAYYLGLSAGAVASYSHRARTKLATS